MVQAILEERKTQTRRTKGLESINENPDNWTFIGFDGKFFNFQNNANPTIMTGIPCPYGKPGDILWVRETFAEYYDPNGHLHTPIIAYKADDNANPVRWKPSIHMPKAAARIWLEIVSVRVERLHDISEQDAVCEGVERIADYGTTGYKLYTDPDKAYSDIDAKWSFESLWESINGKDSLEANPWVWVIEFKQIQKP